MTINSHNGEIVTMVGGYDFNRNKFNNATQAYRQTGSSFKPYIYTAAIEWGMTPDTIISGAQITRGNWTPHNYDGSTSCGDVPMKIALAHSLNIPAVHTLDMIGIQTGAQMVRRFGITVPMAPYLPSALGATEVPLIEMVSAYSTFPNKGVRNEKHLIRSVLDRDGNTLEEWQPTTFKVVSEYVALTMVKMMRGVTAPGGTAPAASSVGVPVAGKTGTVNDQTDVWFIGYTATYTTGVWLGYPGMKSIQMGRAPRPPVMPAPKFAPTGPRTTTTPPVMYSQPCGPIPSTTATAPLLRTAKRIPARPTKWTRPAVAPYKQVLPATEADDAATLRSGSGAMTMRPPERPLPT
jgi:penicillin-binding protein 1A